METPPLFTRPTPHLTLHEKKKKKTHFAFPIFPKQTKEIKCKPLREKKKKDLSFFFIEVKISN